MYIMITMTTNEISNLVGNTRHIQKDKHCLMPKGSFGPGMNKLQVLLDKHECTDCGRLKPSTSERDGVLSTGENTFNHNSRTCDSNNSDLRIKMLKILTRNA